MAAIPPPSPSVEGTSTNTNSEVKAIYGIGHRLSTGHIGKWIIRTAPHLKTNGDYDWRFCPKKINWIGAPLFKLVDINESSLFIDDYIRKTRFTLFGWNDENWMLAEEFEQYSKTHSLDGLTQPFESVEESVLETNKTHSKSPKSNIQLASHIHNIFLENMSKPTIPQQVHLQNLAPKKAEPLKSHVFTTQAPIPQKHVDNDSHARQILGVSLDANAHEIQKAYKTLAKQFHPDKCGGNSDKFLAIKDAYKTLCSNETFTPKSYTEFDDLFRDLQKNIKTLNMKLYHASQERQETSWRALYEQLRSVTLKSEDPLMQWHFDELVKCCQDKFLSLQLQLRLEEKHKMYRALLATNSMDVLCKELPLLINELKQLYEDFDLINNKKTWQIVHMDEFKMAVHLWIDSVIAFERTRAEALLAKGEFVSYFMECRRMQCFYDVNKMSIAFTIRVALEEHFETMKRLNPNPRNIKREPQVDTKPKHLIERMQTLASDQKTGDGAASSSGSDTPKVEKEKKPLSAFEKLQTNIADGDMPQVEKEKKPLSEFEKLKKNIKANIAFFKGRKN